MALEFDQETTMTPYHVGDPQRLRRIAAEMLAEAVEESDKLIAEAKRLEQQPHTRLGTILRGLPTGTIVGFEKTWQRSRDGGAAVNPDLVIEAPRRYLYAAVKTDSGWFTTGAKSRGPYADQAFADWLAGRTVGSGQPITRLTRSQPSVVYSGEAVDVDTLAAVRRRSDHDYVRGNR